MHIKRIYSLGRQTDRLSKQQQRNKITHHPIWKCDEYIILRTSCHINSHVVKKKWIPFGSDRIRIEWNASRSPDAEKKMRDTFKLLILPVIVLNGHWWLSVETTDNGILLKFNTVWGRERKKNHSRTCCVCCGYRDMGVEISVVIVFVYTMPTATKRTHNAILASICWRWKFIGWLIVSIGIIIFRFTIHILHSPFWR